jgi:hypothetical protein
MLSKARTLSSCLVTGKDTLSLIYSSCRMLYGYCSCHVSMAWRHRLTIILWRIWPFGRKRLCKHCLKGVARFWYTRYSMNYWKPISMTTDLVTMEWEAFPWQRIHKQQKQKPLMRSFPTRFTKVYKRPDETRRQNPVPGGITRPPCSWGIQIQGPGPPGWGSLKSETVKWGHEPRGTRTWEWMRWRRQQEL